MSRTDEFEICKNCDYWEAQWVADTATGSGRCRLNAPPVSVSYVTWPSTDQDDWCGSFFSTDRDEEDDALWDEWMSWKEESKELNKLSFSQWKKHRPKEGE